MKIKNTLTLLASIFIAFAIFACNHSPQAKGKDDKDNKVVNQDTIATALATKLKEIDAAVDKVKAAITTNASAWFESDEKIKADGVTALNKLVKDNGLGDTLTGITAGETLKSAVIAAVTTAGKNTKKAAAKLSLVALKAIKGYEDETAAKKFLKEHKALKDIITDLLD